MTPDEQPDLDDPIPMTYGSHAFDCPEEHGPMSLATHYTVPLKHTMGTDGTGIGVWHCVMCVADWYKDGDEWYRKERTDQ